MRAVHAYVGRASACRFFVDYKIQNRQAEARPTRRRKQSHLRYHRQHQHRPEKSGPDASRRDSAIRRPCPYGWKPILSHKVVNSSCAFLTNTTQLEKLRKRFEAHTCPVKNVGGVRQECGVLRRNTTLILGRNGILPRDARRHEGSYLTAVIGLRSGTALCSGPIRDSPGGLR